MRWLLAAGALLLGPVFAQAAAVITLQPGDTLYAHDLAEGWVDNTGNSSLQQALQPGAPFKPLSTDAIQPLAGHHTLWLRLRLLRTADDPEPWRLSVPLPVLDQVTLWQQDARGQWRGQTAGDTIPVNAWPEAGRYPSFRLDLPAGQPRDVYLQIRSLTPTSVPIRLAADAVHAHHVQVEYLGLGITLGTLLLLIVACGAQSWVYRDSVYAWYAGYAAITTLAGMAYTGIAAHLLWPFSGFWADTAQGVLACVFAGSAMLFVRNLTGIEVRHRGLDRAARLGGAFGLLLGVAYIAIPRPAGLALMSGYVALATFTNLVVAALAWRRGDKVGLWVLGALAPQALAVLAALLRVFGLLPASFFTQYAVVAAQAIEVPLLLIALQIRSRERHGAQIREQALSTQDALTGLLAPHLFHDRLRQVVSRFRRDRESAAVVFIDLVNYPWIKNAWGSAVAEQSLLRSVIKLRRLLRDVDTVSRVGEARFGVILEGVDARAVVTDRAARLIAAGLMPLKGLKPEVTLQFHVAAVLLDERVMEAHDLGEALADTLARMSPRTRRPIRFLDPEITQPQPVAPDSYLPPSGDAAPALQKT